MRIAVVACSGIYPIHDGGPASVGYFLAREFSREGHNTTLFVRARDNDESGRIRAEARLADNKNLDVKTVRMSYKPLSLLNVPLLMMKVLEFGLKFSRSSYDVVLFNSPPIDIALLAPIISRLKGTQQAIIFHGYGGIYQGKASLGRALLVLERKLFRVAVTNSESSVKIARGFGFHEEDIIVIPNGLDTQLIEEASSLDLPGCPKVLYVGMLTPLKGVDTLIRAFGVFVQEFPEARLYVVGDGPHRKSLERLTKDLSLTDVISFEGSVPGDKVQSYYKSSHIFVLPSHHEGFGIVILEAMSAKLLVVSSDAGGISRHLIRHDVNGLLFPPGDWVDLARSIKDIWRRKDRMKEVCLRNQELIEEEYSWRKIGRQYVSLFNLMLTRRHRSDL